MRFFGLFFLVLLFTPSFLNAAYTYIKIGSTSSTPQLKSTLNILNKLAQKPTYRTTRNGYIIYAGPYRNNQSANSSLRKLKRYFPSARVVKTQARPTPPKNSTKSTSHTQTKKDTNTFVALSLGYASATLENAGNVDIYLPQDTGLSLDLHVGYFYTQNFFSTFGYLRSDFSDVVFDNYYVSLNYQCDDYGNFTPYLGLMGGYSSLTWNTNPLDNTTQKSSSTSESFFGGVQAGVTYKWLKDVKLFVNYQCMFMNHTTVVTVDTNNSDLKHDTLHNIGFGIRYSF